MRTRRNLRIAAHFLSAGSSVCWMNDSEGAAAKMLWKKKMLFHSLWSGQSCPEAMESSPGTDDFGIVPNRVSRWLTVSAIVLFLCGILAIVLPFTFSVGIAALLGCLLVVAAAAHLVFGIQLEAAVGMQPLRWPTWSRRSACWPTHCSESSFSHSW